MIAKANSTLVNYPKMPFRLWLRHMARDRIIDAHRRHRVSAKRSVDREQPLLSLANVDCSSMDLHPALIDPEMTPAAKATVKELARRMKASMRLIPERDGEILLLRHSEHLSNREAAQKLGMTEPAASMRYLRAVRRLRDALQESDSEENDANS